jgi:hypothetical protein
MATKLSPEMTLATTLAAPFAQDSSLQGRSFQSRPLTCRRLPDGGMVVIAADGRKLWFSAAEVAAAQMEMEGKAFQKEKREAAAVKKVPVKLVPLPREPIQLNNGKMLRAAINENQIKNL